MLVTSVQTIGDHATSEAEMRAATMLIEVGDIIVTFMEAWVSLSFAYITAPYFVSLPMFGYLNLIRCDGPRVCDVGSRLREKLESTVRP